jgi:hypothetical protein
MFFVFVSGSKRTNERQQVRHEVSGPVRALVGPVCLTLCQVCLCPVVTLCVCVFCGGSLYVLCVCFWF